MTRWSGIYKLPTSEGNGVSYYNVIMTNIVKTTNDIKVFLSIAGVWRADIEESFNVLTITVPHQKNILDIKDLDLQSMVKASILVKYKVDKSLVRNRKKYSYEVKTDW